MAKHKRGFIFNLHVGSIIRPLWSAGFEWELRLFATASQPVWHLMACGQIRQKLSLSLCLFVFLSLTFSLVCTLCGKRGWYQVSGATFFSRKHASRFTPLLLFAAFFLFFIFLFLSLLLCDCLNEDLIEPNPLICSDSDILPENFAQIVLGFIWVNIESLSGSCE